MQKEWYVVNTYSGHENKVKEKLEMRASTMGLEDYIFRVIVPSQKIVDEKGTTTSVSESIVLNRYCGDTIYIDDYVKTIANREFIYSTKQKVVMTKNNETVNLYYGLEGENVYD